MTLKMAVVSLFSVAFQFGLAILGRGGLAPFFSHPPLAALLIVTAVLLFAVLFTGGNLSSGEQLDRGNRWVLAVFTILIAYLPAFTRRKGILVLGRDTARW